MAYYIHIVVLYESYSLLNDFIQMIDIDLDIFKIKD